MGFDEEIITNLLMYGFGKNIQKYVLKIISLLTNLKLGHTLGLKLTRLEK